MNLRTFSRDHLHLSVSCRSLITAWPLGTVTLMPRTVMLVSLYAAMNNKSIHACHLVNGSS